MIEVIHFQRQPGPRAFSIERLFDDLRAAMPTDIRCHKVVAPRPSRGFWPRVASVRDARRNAGMVNHVTGDIQFLALGLPGRNTILTIHDCGILHRSRGLKRMLLRHFWFSRPAARCRVVTAISFATRQELIELAGVPAGKVRVIYDCVSPEFVRSPAVFNAARPTILLLGTAPNKNLARMAEALAGTPCAVELVGQPSPEQDAEFVRHGVELTALGDISDAAIHEAYLRCDLVLFASTHEGFGLPILEAQAVGRPVVTSYCSSMPEVAGGAACLVDPFDPASIRAGVSKVVRDEAFRRLLVERGLENVKRFSARRIAGEFAELYREVARDGPGR